MCLGDGQLTFGRKVWIAGKGFRREVWIADKGFGSKLQILHKEFLKNS